MVGYISPALLAESRKRQLCVQQSNTQKMGESDLMLNLPIDMQYGDLVYGPVLFLVVCCAA